MQRIDFFRSLHLSSLLKGWYDILVKSHRIATDADMEIHLETHLCIFFVSAMVIKHCMTTGQTWVGSCEEHTFVSRPIMYSNNTFLRYSISVASEHTSVLLYPESEKSRRRKQETFRRKMILKGIIVLFYGYTPTLFCIQILINKLKQHISQNECGVQRVLIFLISFQSQI